MKDVQVDKGRKKEAVNTTIILSNYIDVLHRYLNSSLQTLAKDMHVC